ncbi:methyltransferase-like protein 22 [Coccinella septempunctata]|uniref:methyltransferase-like protein 22 n=1 Tax=Coccinella septempunctata TaxID=41139 RepID=UPI001D067EE1|nr:methyltransferase-like protein 22 [Coccinella septempunctata]
MDYKVISEIYNEFDYTTSIKPIVNKENVVSTFKFKCPPEKPKSDKDGDLIVSRKSKENFRIIQIEHSRCTDLDLVGLQMWRGSLLLADWLISNADKFPKDSYILELSGGVGFTAIVASMYYPVICTDVEKGDLFQLLNSNIKRNQHLVKNQIHILNFDFFTQIIPNFVVENFDKISVILAAEVIYDDELTDAFIKTVEHILNVSSSEKVVYLTFERRYVFTIEDCDSVAPCFEHFLRQIHSSKLCYQEVPIDFPQYFQYDRIKQMVFCKLSLRK